MQRRITWCQRHLSTKRSGNEADPRHIVAWLDDLQAVDAQEAIAVEPVPSPKPKRKPTETYRVKLRRNLVAAFNDSELRDLCFDMNVD